MKGSIGVFDSGYGGLTVLKSIRESMPQYDYIYLGDNARAPYGTKDFETVLEYTLQAVKKLFSLGCPLIILACNTASAKALRTIQQTYIADVCPDKRVLGVIRPTTEIVGKLTKTNHIAVLATPGTIKSESYNIEINKFYPECKVTELACPSWVPLVESGKTESEEADIEVEKKINELFSIDKDIDTIVLGCTHYPLLFDKINKYCQEYKVKNSNIKTQKLNIISQGTYVADSLKDYLQRHQDMEERLSKEGSLEFYTTGDAICFENQGSKIYKQKINVKSIVL